MSLSRHRASAAVLMAAFSLVSGTAWSQTQTPPERERPPRQAPADQCYSGGPATPPGPRAGDPQARNPSDQLSQSGGIVCPPAEVDPNMTKPAPDVGNTPVIPPPGGPGSQVQPK